MCILSFFIIILWILINYFKTNSDKCVIIWTSESLKELLPPSRSRLTSDFWVSAADFVYFVKCLNSDVFYFEVFSYYNCSCCNLVELCSMPLPFCSMPVMTANIIWVDQSTCGWIRGGGADADTENTLILSIFGGYRKNK